MVHPPMESKRSNELDVITWSAKEAASIPLPPSLSLNSTIYSIKTEYYNGGSDVRDETYDVDTVDSMREGAEVTPELPHCKSSMSIKTEYLKLPKPHRNQRTKPTSDVAGIKEIVMDSPEIVNSMSLESIKASSSKLSNAASEEEVEVALSRSCSTQNLRPLIMTHSRSSLSSKLSNNAGVTAREQSPHNLPNNMSLNSQKSSKGRGKANIPLALTKSRSSQQSMKSSSSSKQEIAASRSSLSSKLSNNAGVTVREQSPHTLPNNMSLNSQKSSKGGGKLGIPLALTKSRSSQQSMKSSSSSKQERVVSNPSNLSLSQSRSTSSKLSLRTGMQNVPSTPSETETHQMPLEIPNSISQMSSKVADSAGIPLSLPKSQSNLSRKSMSSNQAEMTVVKSVSGSNLSISHTRSNDSTKSASKQARVAEIPLSITKSLSTLSRKSSSSKKSEIVSVKSVSNSNLSVTRSDSNHSTKSASQKENIAGSIPSSHSNSSNLPISRSASTNERVTIETQPQSVKPDLIPPNTSSSMRSVSCKASKDEDATGIPLTLPKSSCNQCSKSTPSKKIESANPKSVDTDIATSSNDHISNVMSAASPMVYTALDGNILWKIMNQEMDYDLDDESSMNKTEESNIFAEIEKKLSRDNKTSHLRQEEEVWDNSIEVSYSDLGDFLKEINEGAAAEDPSFILSPNCPTSPRRKAKWLKLRKIFAGKSGYIHAALLEKKMKSKLMLKRLSKKKLREEKQCEATKMTGTAVDETNNENDEPDEEEACGEFGKAVQYDKNNNIERAVEEEKVDRLNDAEATPSPVEPSSLPWNTPDVVFDNNAFCSKLAWDEAICNFQEAKAAIFGLTGSWMADKEEPVPKVRLDEGKANQIIAASKELYRQREMIKEKSADLEVQQKVAKNKRAKEKMRHLVKELSDVKRAEDESFALFKDLFTSLSSKERKLAIKLGDDVARAAKEVRSLQCDAVVEVETSLPAGWGEK